jgi:beta-glucosidase
MPALLLLPLLLAVAAPTAPADASACACAVCPCAEQALLPRTCAAGSVAHAMPFCDATKPTDARVADLLSRLTRQEKISLVERADTGFLPRLNLKEFEFFNTCLHGWATSNVTNFGMPIGFAASFDLGLMKQIGEVVGSEGQAMSQRDYNASYNFALKVHGVAYNWGVCKDSSEVNMARDPRWGRVSETYGEDPFLTSTMGEVFTKQLQRPDPSIDFLRVAAVTRHSVVYSGPESLCSDAVAPSCSKWKPTEPERSTTQGSYGTRFAFNAQVSERDLEDYFYPPFEATISRERGASAGVMCSDAAQNGVPSCASSLLMKQKIKDWNATEGFFTVSDMGTYYNVYVAHHYSNSTAQALYEDLGAGLGILYERSGKHCAPYNTNCSCLTPQNKSCDISSFSAETYDALNAATNGSVSDARFGLEQLDSKAATVLQMRFSLGEFDETPANYQNQHVPASVIKSPAHRAIARQAAAQATVLVKNTGGLLPISRAAAAQKLALIGPWMRPALQPPKTNKQGQQSRSLSYVHTYGNENGAEVDILSGIQAVVNSTGTAGEGEGEGEAGGTEITFEQGCFIEKAIKGQEDFASAVAAAKQADVAVVALGLSEDIWDSHGVGGETEGHDRLSLELPQVQIDLLKAVRKVARKLVLIIVCGSAVHFDETLADAAVYALYGGEEAGHGLADVLFGSVPPSARLPFTVFSSVRQLPLMGDYNLTASPGRTHLYYDKSAGAPQHWFGFGLGYEHATYGSASARFDGATCSVNVTASISRADHDHSQGAATTVAQRSATQSEVSQLYMSAPPQPNLPAAKWALRGYAHTELGVATAETELSFKLSAYDLSTVLSDGTRKVFGGEYKLSVGGCHPRESPPAGGGCGATNTTVVVALEQTDACAKALLERR